MRLFHDVATLPTTDGDGGGHGGAGAGDSLVKYMVTVMTMMWAKLGRVEP